MDLMRELLEQGHEVYALGSDDAPGWQDEFSQYGICYGSFRVSRNGVSPVEDIRTFHDLHAAISEIAPDRVFVYQAKSIVYGCPAARRAGVPEVYPLVAGLGSVFRGGDLKSRLIRRVLSYQYKRAFRDCRSVFFQ
ncbi:MAG: glycosyltransferase, partial [Actinomycetota bacterium]|nr:glycosyltransferase [Actinomycetota bacterium]